MLKKWFIEKCCFTYYCTVQLYKIVLKAWKQSALEHLQHPVLRQLSTWGGRVGEAALLFVSEVELAVGGFPAEMGPQPSRLLMCVEPLGSINGGSHHWSQSLLGSVHQQGQRKSFISAPSYTLGGKLFWALLPHWSLGNSSNAIYKASCSRCDSWIQCDRLLLRGILSV